MALHARDQEIPRRQRVQQGATGEGSMVVKKGYGNECSLMVAVRAPGYHTKPHAHESEQINYVLEGEIWFFVEDRGFHCKQGDFQRIPANKTHWAWNRSDENATVAEAHAPALIGGRSGREPLGSLMTAKLRWSAGQAKTSMFPTTRVPPRKSWGCEVYRLSPNLVRP